MSNLIFPTLPGLAWNVSVAPTFTTAVKTAVSGKEQRTSYQAYPLWKISLSYEFLRDGNRGTDLDTLAAFFLTMKGQWDSFLFTMPSDNTVTAMNFGTGDGSNRYFQISRAISGGGFASAEPVMNLPGTGTQIYVNGTLKTLTTDYLLSAGLVTFGTAPANGASLTWSGSFYYRCRFLQDTAEFLKFMQDLWELKKIAFIGSPANKV
jgi:uncharacterized protein (TIGR02217 family)